MRKSIIITMSGLIVWAMSSALYAQPQPGFGPHHGGRGGFCKRMLFMGPLDQVKSMLNLTADQVKQIQLLRDNFSQQRANLHSQMKPIRQSLQQQMQSDLPQQGVVLNLVRQKHALRGKFMEFQVTNHLKLLSILTPAQRETLRKSCPNKGMGQKWGIGSGRGWGRRGQYGMGNGVDYE